MADETKTAAHDDELNTARARALSPAAKRALAEAQARREAQSMTIDDLPPEIGGRDGPEPVRYGDWEKKGIISDF